MRIDWLTLLLSLVLNLALIIFYDYLVLDLKLKNSRIEVADIDYILTQNERLVQEGKLSIESYKLRVSLAERIVAERNSIVLNKYIKFGQKLYPLAFGGEDITEEIIKELESIP